VKLQRTLIYLCLILNAANIRAGSFQQIDMDYLKDLLEETTHVPDKAKKSKERNIASIEDKKESKVLLQLNESQYRIKNLFWKDQEFELLKDKNGKYVKLNGVFKRPGWSLIFDFEPIALENGKSFEHRVSLPDDTKKITVKAISPEGYIKKEYIELKVVEK